MRFIHFDSLDLFDLDIDMGSMKFNGLFGIFWDYTWLHVVIQGCIILPRATHDISVSEKQLRNDEACLYNDIPLIWFCVALFHCDVEENFEGKNRQLLVPGCSRCFRCFRIQTILYFLMLAGPEAVRVRLPVPPLCWHLR